jgi:hypothetical protein
MNQHSKQQDATDGEGLANAQKAKNGAGTIIALRLRTTDRATILAKAINRAYRICSAPRTPSSRSTSGAITTIAIAINNMTVTAESTPDLALKNCTARAYHNLTGPHVSFP